MTISKTFFVVLLVISVNANAMDADKVVERLQAYEKSLEPYTEKLESYYDAEQKKVSSQPGYQSSGSPPNIKSPVARILGESIEYRKKVIDSEVAMTPECSRAIENYRSTSLPKLEEIFRLYIEKDSKVISYYSVVMAHNQRDLLSFINGPAAICDKSK